LNSFRAQKRGLKNYFAECFTLTLGKEAFAECFFALGKETSLPSAEALPSVFYLAHGKEADSGMPPMHRTQQYILLTHATNE
jgi:hypothetical protein